MEYIIFEWNLTYLNEPEIYERKIKHWFEWDLKYMDEIWTTAKNKYHTGKNLCKKGMWINE